MARKRRTPEAVSGTEKTPREKEEILRVDPLTLRVVNTLAASRGQKQSEFMRAHVVPLLQQAFPDIVAAILRDREILDAYDKASRIK